jgi:hypothetical protein
VEGSGMMDVNSYIKDLFSQFRNKQEEYLLNFFGDLETAKKYAPYFILETVYPPDYTYGELTATFTLSYCLRLRTEEELYEAGIEKPYPLIIQDMHERLKK